MVEKPRRSLTIFLSLLIFASNAASVFVLHYLPDDPFRLALQISIYSYFAGSISLLGLIGAIKRKSIFVTIFANHLLLDALLCTVPRVLIMVFLSGLRESFCQEHGSNFFQQPLSQSQDPTVDNVVFQLGVEQQRCMKVLWGIQAGGAITAVVTTTAQWMLAMRIREYARTLTKREDSEVVIIVEHIEEHKSLV